MKKIILGLGTMLVISAMCILETNKLAKKLEEEQVRLKTRGELLDQVLLEIMLSKDLSLTTNDCAENEQGRKET